MQNLPELLVIRHGETEWNRSNRMQGRLDSPLTARGCAQAEAVGGLLRALEVSGTSHAFWTSPQPRSVETARLALAPIGQTARPDPDLMEVDIGDWSGALMSELAATGQGLLPEETHTEYCFRAQGGEGENAVRARVERVLSRIDRPTVIFTHGMTGRVLRTLALGWGIDRLGELPGGQGVVFRIADGAHETLEPPGRTA